MDRDQIIERGRDVEEMERTPGWLAVKGEIEKELSEQEDALKLVRIDDRSPSEVGGEYIAITRHIAGLRRALEIVESLKEDRIREEKNEHDETQG